MSEEEAMHRVLVFLPLYDISPNEYYWICWVLWWAIKD